MVDSICRHGSIGSVCLLRVPVGPIVVLVLVSGTFLDAHLLIGVSKVVASDMIYLCDM